jgi:hypothetical protein
VSLIVAHRSFYVCVCVCVRKYIDFLILTLKYRNDALFLSVTRLSFVLYETWHAPECFVSFGLSARLSMSLSNIDNCIIIFFI